MASKLKKVMKHLKGDVKMFKEEAKEDKKLIKSLDKKKSSKKKHEKKESKAHERKEDAKEKKVEKVMREYKKGKLHSGSKKGPKVKSRSQAIAIGLSEAKRVGKKKK